MEYTIKQLADIAGVSTRTLRYYDQIDLLKPNYNSRNNYRIYTEKQVNQLQRILFYKALEFPLVKIQNLMQDDSYSELSALQEQQELLRLKRQDIDSLLTTIDKTIKDKRGELTMTDTEKFAAFKNAQLNENEEKFGNEIREKYGEDEIENSNQKFMNLSEEDVKKMKTIEDDMFKNLALVKADDLDSEVARRVYEDHKDWLSYSWPNYSVEAHRGLVDMYLVDERFAKYYNDRAGKQVVQLLHDVVYHYTK
ncbi:MerR family transcriptional regulator [Companilactobacillus jidongensis]|uniref:MerR family transcriptional regulator n=1 Tax=Companilactobacillus jidongensis TaxID=2486006 RepID=UPI000F78B812|nr:MerR family transcriptional regulator [Companilactobacillus jidongensis]